MRKSLLIVCVVALSAALVLTFQRTNISNGHVNMFRTNLMNEIISFDPRIADDSVSLQMHYLLFSGLTTLDAKGEVELDLAQSYTLSEDQKTYCFKLKDSRWSDGTPITAYDFEQSWQEYTQEGFPASLWEMVSMVKKVHSLDARTLEIELEYPLAYFLQLLAHPTMFPVHQSMRGDFHAHRHLAPLSIVYSGPYFLKVYNDQVELLLEKNPHYYHAKAVKFDKIHLSRIRDAQTALALFEKGEFDWLGGPFSELPLDALPSLRKKGLLKSHPLLDTRFLYFNTQEYPFNNAHVRKALALAIDRQAIVRDVLQNDDLPGLGYVPYAQKKEQWHPYFQDGDVKLAKEHFKLALEELHLTADQFPEIVLSYNTSELWKRVIQAVQQQWRQALGVRVQIQNADWPMHMDKLKRGLFQVARSGRTADFNDSMAFLQQLLSFNSQNFCRWKNEQYDALVMAVERVRGGDERLAYYEKAEQVLADDMPLIPLIYPNAYSIQRENVQGIAVSPLYYVIFNQAQ